MLEHIRPVAYRLALPPSLARLHNLFHVFQLRKCLFDLDVVIEMSQLEVQPNHTMPKQLVKILDHAEKVLRHKTISIVKVLSSGQARYEATWETEDSMRRRYP